MGANHPTTKTLNIQNLKTCEKLGGKIREECRAVLRGVEVVQCSVYAAAEDEGSLASVIHQSQGSTEDKSRADMENDR